ncbi:MAG: aminotransferase class V-fold PLP-dependent enzyme [Erysipelotrichaceae bacterium]|nr:aminotransferase class V-fold PLP-dependent enzyme [Erysipelotrichaceae bacterium]
MKKIREYCEKELGFRLYTDGFLDELSKLLKSKKIKKDEGFIWLKKETEDLCRLLKKEGHETEGKKTLVHKLLTEYLKKEADAVVFETHPLKMISMQEEIENQYRMVDIMHRHFDGFEALEAGDYGCHIRYGRPERTVKVEEILAEYFHVEAAALVRGGGTGAIRAMCYASLKPGDRVLIHDAPLYKTTQITLEAMGIEIIKTDFNDFRNIERELKNGIDVLYIQRVRQKLSDSYDEIKIIEKARKIDPKVTILTDENYAVNKVEKLGAAAGADMSAFSTFKLLGIPGIGLVVGTKKMIDIVHEQNYSGGGQVQGPEAMETLRSLVENPVLLGVQSLSVDEIVKRLNQKEVPHVEKALKANIEERIILVKLDLPIAREVIERAISYGALPHPVGSESRYEVQTLFYRIAKIMIDENPVLSRYVIRINPMRSGPDTVIRILKDSIEDVMKKKQ